VEVAATAAVVTASSPTSSTAPSSSPTATTTAATIESNAVTGASSVSTNDDGKMEVLAGHWLLPVHSEDGRTTHLQLLPSATLSDLRVHIARAFIIPPHKADKLRVQLMEKHPTNPLIRGGLRELPLDPSMTLEEAKIGDGHRNTIIVTNAALLSSKKYYTGSYALAKLLEKW
jgi:hypothetical protein